MNKHRFFFLQLVNFWGSAPLFHSVCWVLLPPSLVPNPPSAFAGSSVHSARGQKKLLTVSSDLAAQGLAQGTGTTSLMSTSPRRHPWARDVKSTQSRGSRRGPAPVCFDSFLPHRLCPFGPRSIWLHSLPKSLSALFSIPSPVSAKCFNSYYQTIFKACCFARLLGTDCKLTNWLEAFICQLCSEILLFFN